LKRVEGKTLLNEEKKGSPGRGFALQGGGRMTSTSEKRENWGNQIQNSGGSGLGGAQ